VALLGIFNEWRLWIISRKIYRGVIAALKNGHLKKQLMDWGLRHMNNTPHEHAMVRYILIIYILYRQLVVYIVHEYE